jgi:serine phosphatase RsbU (regulator of sigma subunit)
MAVLALMVLSCSGHIRAQRVNVDSLETVLKTYAADDPRRIDPLLDIAEEKWQLDHSLAYRYALEARALAEPLGEHHALARAIGLIAKEQSMFMDREFSSVGLKLEAMRHAEATNDSLLMAQAYIQFASQTYSVTDSLDRFLFNGIRLARKENDPRTVAIGYFSLARRRLMQHRLREALEFNRQSIQVAREAGEELALIAGLVNLANIHMDNESPDSMVHYLEMSIGLAERAGEFRFRSYALGLLARHQYASGQRDRALATAHEALAIAQQNGLNKEMRDAYETLSALYIADGDHREGHDYYLKFDSARNAVLNAQAAENAGRLRAEYVYTQQQEAAAAENAAREMRQKNWMFLAIVLTAAAAVVTMVVYRSLQQTRRAMRMVEEQKRLVENKQREIIDSITYSKRLQDAILPSPDQFQQYFPESFVLYLPKDIVAGDFYWLRREGDTLFVAAADCTGHGVPGALVSVVCATALGQAVREHQLTDPGRVLDVVTALVRETFGDDRIYVKDGMDISLLAIGLKERTVRWCGANIPLYYFRNAHGLVPASFSKVDPDRQPVGRHENHRPFTTVELDLPPGTVLYLFSDGYADQFGGEKDRKFMMRSFQQLLVEAARRPMAEQEHLLRNTLENWKNGHEQTDDITVMGIRL